MQHMQAVRTTGWPASGCCRKPSILTVRCESSHQAERRPEQRMVSRRQLEALTLALAAAVLAPTAPAQALG